VSQAGGAIPFFSGMRLNWGEFSPLFF
jgi:hypothetical protein